ncbi:L-2-hydroxyglutarate oxidase [Humibacter sp.]|uniref:L-2-hydroxyglutarate oxidase n=1 Tax=Humibacter sp. TaxID=1940291 RepID=UPI003F80890B
MARVVVVGSGIVGLAVARELSMKGDSIMVIEKEADLARHQTGRNSGVIHSGIYYKPGSYKATMCTAGALSMKEYAAEHDVACETPGKLIIATTAAEIPQLAVLEERGKGNGVPVRRVTAAEAREYEPNVRCLAALRVESTGIVDYVGICRAMAAEIVAAGGELRFSERFIGAEQSGARLRVRTSRDEFEADFLVNCAGLQSDKVARACGLKPDLRIIPFRGEYFELAGAKASMVNGLIYPVPDPNFPFLGVHLTKMIGGGVHVGPNAVFAMAREGYRWRDVNVRDVWDSATWPGLWVLGAKNAKAGMSEFGRSVMKSKFAKSLDVMVPGIDARDLQRAPAGVRAQAMRSNGVLVDDFAILRGSRQIHVLNAPSPAATASLEIAKHIRSEIDEMSR